MSQENEQAELVETVTTEQGTTALIPAIPKGDPMLAVVHSNFAAVVKAEQDAIKHAVKLNITDAATRDDAIALIKTLKKVPKLLDEMAKQATADASTYIADVKKLRDGFGQTFVNCEKHANAALTSYNLRVEQEAKLERERILREQEERRRKEEADRRIREAEEEKRKIEEAERLKRIQEEQAAALKKIKSKDRLAAELKAQADLEAERARVEREQAERDAELARIDSERKAEEERKDQEARNAILEANSAGKTKGMQRRWKYDIVDETQVVRDLCEPARGKILEAVNAGLRNTDADGKPNPRAAGLLIYQDASASGR